jgi:hypothetical protein
MDDREAKLPVWAKELLAYQRKQVAMANEPLVRELATLRPLVEKLKNKNSALTQLLECAAKGGHITAQEIVAELRVHELIE